MPPPGPPRPTSPTVELRLTMAPPPEASVAGISYFMPRNTPLRLVAMTRSNSSSLTSTHAGVVDGDIEPAVGLNRAPDEALDRGGIGHIRLDRYRLTPVGLDRFNVVCQLLLTAGGQHHGCTGLYKQVCCRRADALTGARDERHFAF